jgi:hypothetical protein
MRFGANRIAIDASTTTANHQSHSRFALTADGGYLVAGYYTVKQGEYVSSIAARNGFPDYTIIWNDPNNAALKRLRKSPNILLPGDQLFVPDVRQRQELRATDKLHRFKVKLEKISLHIVLKDADGKAISDEPYTLAIEGKTFEGTTDGGGAINQPIDVGQENGLLTLSRLEQTFSLKMGHLDPIKEEESEAVVSGVQARLNNLGFNCGPVTNEVSDDIVDALTQFQKAYSLRTTGEMDAPTVSKLQDLHGS